MMNTKANLSIRPMWHSCSIPSCMLCLQILQETIYPITHKRLDRMAILLETSKFNSIYTSFSFLSLSLSQFLLAHLSLSLSLSLSLCVCVHSAYSIAWIALGDFENADLEFNTSYSHIKPPFDVWNESFEGIVKVHWM